LKIYVSLAPVRDLASLRERVAALDAAGVDGVFASDHLFFAPGGERAGAFRANDPFVVLGAVAAMSDRLELGTLVANIGFSHPALVLRHFAQLAGLVGGDRVIAGIGAGWNTEEFDALGFDMPRHADRLDRLEEACRLARALLDDGIASVAGDHVVSRELPVAPKFKGTPRLLLGGGSDRLLDIAGRYADHVDLNGSSRRQPVRRAQPLFDDHARRRGTTVDDLVDAAARVRAAAEGAGRPCPTFSVILDTVAVGHPVEPGIEDCPYVLGGDADAIGAVVADRVARIGLGAVVIGESPEVSAAVRALRRQ
jgi:alkanesulfonate monooxygenase SsuD/methylene tetrahydromethanopterin reductase-like flavin-dependent oxidoreductase (luciferase family)